MFTDFLQTLSMMSVSLKFREIQDGGILSANPNITAFFEVVVELQSIKFMSNGFDFSELKVSTIFKMYKIQMCLPS